MPILRRDRKLSYDAPEKAKRIASLMPTQERRRGRYRKSIDGGGIGDFGFVREMLEFGDSRADLIRTTQLSSPSPFRVSVVP